MMNTEKQNALRRFLAAAKELFGEDEVRKALDDPPADGFSEKQKRLIAELRSCGQVKSACERADVPQGTYRRWRSTNGGFKTAADDALEHGRQKTPHERLPKSDPKGEELSARIPRRPECWQISPWPARDDAMPMTAPLIRR